MINKQVKVHITNDVLLRWQTIVDTIAELACIPASLIMRVDNEYIEVFVASSGEQNPYKPGSREHLIDSGLYCESVLKNKEPLLIPDALNDPNWKNNPDIKLGMISYLGFPILFPDGTPFGTLCILDNKPNTFSNTIFNLLDNFRYLLQDHLALLYMNEVLGEENANLLDYLNELQSLRGLVSICAQCKKIKDEKGGWRPVEEYLIKHPAADFSHGYCPDCYRRILTEI